MFETTPARLPSCVIVDIDGTVSVKGDRNPYSVRGVGLDEVNLPVVAVVRALADAGNAIIFVTGRVEATRRETSSWIAFAMGVESEALFMRKDGDMRPDAEVKFEIFEGEIEPNFSVLVVLDDRNQTVAMWRDLGLTCLQVAYGDF